LHIFQYIPVIRYDAKSIKEKLVRWVFYGVVLAIVPILLRHIYTGKSWDIVLAKGDLLLTCTAIAGAAIGDITGSDFPRSALKTLVTGLLVTSLLAAALWYAAVDFGQDSQDNNTSTTQTSAGSKPRSGAHASLGVVSRGSLLLFTVVFMVGGAAVVLADARVTYTPATNNESSEE
jgi:hypothetical protein